MSVDYGALLPVIALVRAQRREHPNHSSAVQRSHAFDATMPLRKISLTFAYISLEVSPITQREAPSSKNLRFISNS